MKTLFAFLVLLLAIPSFAARPVRVKSTVTKTGTVKQTHYRTAPNKTKSDNYSTKGNTNPYTGKKGTKDQFKK
jgi:hypothetical protein